MQATRSVTCSSCPLFLCVTIVMINPTIPERTSTVPGVSGQVDDQVMLNIPGGWPQCSRGRWSRDAFRRWRWTRPWPGFRVREWRSFAAAQSGKHITSNPGYSGSPAWNRLSPPQPIQLQRYSPQLRWLYIRRQHSGFGIYPAHQDANLSSNHQALSRHAHAPSPACSTRNLLTTQHSL